MERERGRDDFDCLRSIPGLRMGRVATKWFQLKTTNLSSSGSSTLTSRYIIHDC